MWWVLERVAVPFKIIHNNTDSIFTWLFLTEFVISIVKSILELYWRKPDEDEAEDEEMPDNSVTKADSSSEEEPDFTLNLETRDKWHADPPNSKEPLLGQAQYVFCAMQTECEPCKDIEECSSLVREMQFEHRRYEKLPDIRYNFLIGGDGRVYEGRGWNVRPTLPERYSHLSSRSYYIAFIGDLREDPSELMFEQRDILLAGMMNAKMLNPKYLQFDIQRLDRPLPKEIYREKKENEKYNI